MLSFFKNAGNFFQVALVVRVPVLSEQMISARWWAELCRQNDATCTALWVRRLRSSSYDHTECCLALWVLHTFTFAFSLHLSTSFYIFLQSSTVFQLDDPRSSKRRWCNPVFLQTATFWRWRSSWPSQRYLESAWKPLGASFWRHIAPGWANGQRVSNPNIMPKNAENAKKMHPIGQFADQNNAITHHNTHRWFFCFSGDMSINEYQSRTARHKIPAPA